MVLRTLLAFLAMTICFGGVVGQERASGATIVASGQTTRVGLINPVDPQSCKVSDDLVATVSREAAAGEIELRRESVILTTSRCGQVEVMGYAIYYRSQRGFVGRDRVAVTFRNETRNITDVYFFALDVR